VQPKPIIRWFLIIILITGFLHTAGIAQAAKPDAEPAQSGVTAFDLIIAMNTLRVSYGLPALVEDPIVNAVAQSTAEIMAANQMSWHIGDVRGRIAAAGYGGGATVWATENFAMGTNYSIDEIMVAWSDESHMLPAVKPAYCNVGAGVAQSASGMTYYVLQAAYVAGKSCGDYTSVGGSNTQPGGTTSSGSVGVPGIIVPVKIATPDADGKIFHVVQSGQSFWSIAVAYQITIKDIETWNNISRESKLQVGQKLFIPTSNTEGYATPTPVGMIQVSEPDENGKIVHTVHAYNTLTTIAEAYKVDIQTILNLNGWQLDWPLSIDQKLLIYPGNVTPSPTPRPLTAIEMLTPASDGKYYHTVKGGETLSGIAGIYKINVYDLMAWNGLNSASIIRPDQKLLLQVTPPATNTHTPGPPTATSTTTPIPPTLTPSPTHTEPPITPTVTVEPSMSNAATSVVWYVSAGLLAGGFVLFVLIRRKPGRGSDSS